MACLAVFNQKGGVAKTTTTLNLAGALARAGNAPLAIDLDPQGHLTALSGLTPADSASSIYAFYRDHRQLADLQFAVAGRGSIIAAHLELAKVDTQFGKGPNILNRLRLGLQREHLLHGSQPVVIDCSPMLGVLSLSAIFAADRVLVPVSADYLAMKSAMQVEKTLNALAPVLKQRIARCYVITRFDGRRRMSWDIDRAMRAHFGAEVCTTRIHENVALAESPYANRDVFTHAPNSRGAQDYQGLYEELQQLDFLPAQAMPSLAVQDPQAQALLSRLLTKPAKAVKIAGT